MSQTMTHPGSTGYIKRFDVRSDGMSAKVIIGKTPRALIPKVKQDIIDVLVSKGITYGVLDHTIDIIFEQGLYGQEIEVARGISVVHGVDSYIKRITHMQKEKEIDINLDVNLVSEGDLLFEVIPLTIGSHGMNVFGHVSFAKPGRDLSIQFGEGIKLSQDGIYVIAAKAGYLQVNQTHVDVVLNYTIEGSVNRHTGHIRFPGNVHVMGDVAEGYSIEAEGSVTIDGLVDAATIVSGDSIVIKKGLIGANRAVLSAKHDITIDFIENASCVEAGNNIYTHLVLNSNLYAMNSVIVEEDGQIIGGRTVAHNKIICKIAGFKSYVKTELVVGLTKDRLEQIEETTALIQKLKSENNEVRKNIAFLEDQLLHLSNAEERLELERDLKELMMTFNYNNGVLSEFEERMQTLMLTVNDIAKILVSGEIMPMTKVRVNHMERLIDEHMSHRCIFADEEEILIIDLDDCE